MGWNDVIGHDHLAGWFRRQLDSGRLAHAYLFEGPAGVGKKRMALTLARAVNCADLGTEPCERCSSCVQTAELDDAGLMVYCDIDEGRWIERKRAIEWAGSEDLLLEAYGYLLDAGFLNPPPPGGRGEARWDRVMLSPDKVFRRGSMPSPQAALDELAGMGGDEVSDAAAVVGAELFHAPRSVVHYRRSMGIDLVTPRAHSEEMRTVQGFLSRRRLGGRRKIVIVDDAHKMTEQAQNALLKTLEEPPEDSLLVLILDRARELLPTIRSRCQGVSFGVIPEDTLVEALVARGFDREEAAWAAARSGGRFADALGFPKEDFLVAREEMLHTWGEIRTGDVGGLMDAAGLLSHEEITERGARVRRVREHLDQLLMWVRDLLFVAHGAPQSLVHNSDLQETLEVESRKVSSQVLERVFWTVAKTAGELDRNVDLRLALESMSLTLASIVAGRSSASA